MPILKQSVTRFIWERASPKLQIFSKKKKKKDPSAIEIDINTWEDETKKLKAFQHLNRDRGVTLESVKREGGEVQALGDNNTVAKKKVSQYEAITTALRIGSENNGPKQTTNQRWTLTLKTVELRPKGIQLN